MLKQPGELFAIVVVQCLAGLCSLLLGSGLLVLRLSGKKAESKNEAGGGEQAGDKCDGVLGVHVMCLVCIVRGRVVVWQGGWLST